MKTSSFQSFMKTHKEMMDAELIRRINRLGSPKVLKDAMIYSLQAGGKRIRPLLVFAVLADFGKRTSIGLEAASALEMIHTYSLIHDDLPSMDNDDVRRGKPTNHIVFGEANAILAGDALLTLSFHILSNMEDENISDRQKLEIIREISKSAGPEGMVAGQNADMAAEGTAINLQALEYIHEHKTGKLLKSGVLTGAILAEASEEQVKALSVFSKHLGLAFQIRDDILDIEGTQEMIGKPVGSDYGNNKNTYPALLTLQGAKEKLQEEIHNATRALESLSLEESYLMEITKLVAERNN